MFRHDNVPKLRFEPRATKEPISHVHVLPNESATLDTSDVAQEMIDEFVSAWPEEPRGSFFAKRDDER